MKKLLSLRTVILVASLLLHSGALCYQSHAAVAGDVDLSFDPGSGINGAVNAVVVQPDGKVIIGGEFTTVRGLVRVNVARLNRDGSGDSSFTAGTFAVENRAVHSLALQPDGKVLVGHLHGFTRLLADGSVDPGFSPAGTAAIDWINDGFYDGAVYCSARQPDGKVLIGGGFDWINGSVVNLGLARLNADGSLDTGFNVWSGFQDQRGTYLGQVRSVAVESDGKVLVVGDWNPVSSARHAIFRLNADGSLDSSFNPGIGGGGVSVVAMQPDGKVLLGGYPMTVNGTNIASGIARLETNGSLDGSFNPGSETYGGLRSIALLPDGRMLLGGGFTRIGGPNYVARLNADGSRDTSFAPGSGANGPVTSIVLQSNGQWLMAGTFTSVNGTSRNRMARLNADGELDGTFDPGTGVNVAPSSLVLQPDGKVLIGGVFTFINGTNRYGSARLNPDGSVDSTFVPSSFNPDLAFVLPTGDCRGGPDFVCSQSWVARTVMVQADGEVLVGGYSNTVDLDLTDGHPYESQRSFLARLHADGSRDTSFEPAIGGQTDVRGNVSALAVQPDGKVLFGGFLVPFRRLHRDGSPDGGFNPGLESGWVGSIALQPDGEVLIGGSFVSVHGTIRPGIARLHPNGSLDDTFNPAAGGYPIVLQPDGKVLAGIYARLNADGSLDSSFTPGTGANGGVRALALEPDGNILIGGDFLTVNGVLRPYVARLHGGSSPPSFTAWAAGFGLSGAAAAADADPDNDGLPTGVEYVLGANPASPAASASGHPAAVLSGGNLVFTFQRADASEATDVTLTVESGTDLATWPAAFTIGAETATSSPGVTISENGAAADTVTLTIAEGAASRLFARLKVTIAR